MRIEIVFVYICAVWVLILGGGTSASQAVESPRHFIGPGSVLPVFELDTLDGKRFSSSALAGKAGVLAFVRPAQANSLTVLRELERIGKQLSGPVWQRVAICSGGVAATEVKKLVQESAFSGTVLLDPERSVYADFGVIAIPSVAVFDGASKIVYSHPGFGVSLTLGVTEHLSTLLGTNKRSGANDRYRTTPTIELARRLAERGKLEDAEKLLRDELGKDAPLEGYIQLGDVYLRQGMPAKAFDHFHETAKKFPETPRVEIGLARALTALGRAEEAEKALLDVLRLKPKSWEAHYRLGEVHEIRGNKDLAIREYKKAITLLGELRQSAPRGDDEPVLR